eukprot:4795-Eustigmatos_ZCMA.PRE.1
MVPSAVNVQRDVPWMVERKHGLLHFAAAKHALLHAASVFVKAFTQERTPSICRKRASMEDCTRMWGSHNV